MIEERIRKNAWASRTVQQIFRETCAVRNDKPAVIYKNEIITFRQLLDKVDELTARLMNFGIGPGDVISTLPTPTPDFVIVFFAVLQSGAIINPLNLMWDREILARVLERNKPRVIISCGVYDNRDYVERLQQCFGAAPKGNIENPAAIPYNVLISDEMETLGALPDGFEPLRSFVDKPGGRRLDEIEIQVRKSKPDDVQFICQTSGSTGLPKSAIWNHKSPLSTAHFMIQNLGLTDQDRWINIAPLFHNSGICCTTVGALAYGGMTIYMDDRFRADNAVKLIQDEGIESTVGFSAHYVAMRESTEYRSEKFALSKVLLAGAPKFYEYVKNMCVPNATVSNLYAQTENGPLITLTELGNINEKLRGTNSGRPLPGVELKICNVENGERLSDGNSGQIWYKSPYLFRGYLLDDGSYDLPLDEEGFFGSGDYGFTRDGYLTFIERLGGVVKSGGENVSLAKVTEALEAEFGREFESICAIATPDEYWGDRVVAIGRLKKGESIDTSKLRERCKGLLSDYEIPRNFVEWIKPWPTSAEGKLNIKALRQFAIKKVNSNER